MAMPRRQTPLSPDDGSAAQFALDLRALRDSLGPQGPSMGALVKRTGLSQAAVYAAFSGSRVSSWTTVGAIVTVLGGNLDDWFKKWKAADAAVELERRLKDTEQTTSDRPFKFDVRNVGNVISGDGGTITLRESSGDEKVFRTRRRLTDELQAAKAKTGRSYRDLAAEIQSTVTTIHRVFTGASQNWAVVEKVGVALGIDVKELRRLWEVDNMDRVTRIR